MFKLFDRMIILFKVMNLFYDGGFIIDFLFRYKYIRCIE